MLLFQKIFFVHEMTHVWQYQLGYSPFLNGIIIALKGGYINNKAYEYPSKVQSNQGLSDFNMEQQGSIIADYFIDTTNNHTSPRPHPYTKGMPLIDSILKEFKNNPSNKQLLPGDNHA